MEWIDVNERLPDKIANYLVHYVHSYSVDDGYWALGIVYYNGSYFSWHDTAYRITHWMPLPEPPKNDFKEEII